MAKVMLSFRPSAPIDEESLLVGRQEQLRRLAMVCLQRGQHAVVYGERGVGKTSLAAVSSTLLARMNVRSIRINCDGTDSFATIWRKVLAEIHIRRPDEDPAVKGIGFGKEREISEAIGPASALVPAEATPGDVREILRFLTTHDGLAVFLDEFDRITNSDARRLLADTLKGLSDHAVQATVIIIGVADDVDQLLGEHESIGRNLVQVPMQRMSVDEREQIVKRGLANCGMTIETSAMNWITSLSQGLPYYVHQLTQEAALVAVRARRLNVLFDDISTAISEAVAQADRKHSSAYELATYSRKAGAIYPQVLLAAALADTNELGYFAPADVRAPLKRLTGMDYDTKSFNSHIRALCTKERGRVFQERGGRFLHRYKFIDSLFAPYVIMRSVTDGLLRPSEYFG